MSLRLTVTLTKCIIFPLLFTAIVFWFEHQRAYKTAETKSLGWAESLVDQFRELAETSSTQSFLNTQDPRAAVQLHLIPVQSKDFKNPVQYSFSTHGGYFDYVTLINDKKNQALRILIKTGYPGAFGTQSQLSQMLLALAMFGLLFGVTLLLSWKSGSNSASPTLKRHLIKWFEKSNTGLIQVGTHFKGMAFGSRDMNKNVHTLQDRLESLLTRVQGLTPDQFNTEMPKIDVEAEEIKTLVQEALKAGKTSDENFLQAMEALSHYVQDHKKIKVVTDFSDIA